MAIRFSRFTTTGLMAVVALAAASLAALRRPTPLSSALVFAGTFVALLTGLVVAATRRGPGRSAWVGLCIFGWAYFLAFTIEPLRPVREALNTRAIFNYVDARLGLVEEMAVSISDDPYVRQLGRQALVPTGRDATVITQIRLNYYKICDCLMTLVFAALGALVAASARERGPDQPSGETIPLAGRHPDQPRPES